MNSPEVKSFIRKHSDLFWYIPDEQKESISHDVLVEFILNYGDMEAVKELFQMLLQVLTEKQLQILPHLKLFGRSFYLAGGTAIDIGI